MMNQLIGRPNTNKNGIDTIVPLWILSIGAMTGLMTSITAVTYKTGEGVVVPHGEAIAWFLLGGAIGGSTIGLWLGKTQRSHADRTRL